VADERYDDGARDGVATQDDPEGDQPTQPVDPAYEGTMDRDYQVYPPRLPGATMMDGATEAAQRAAGLSRTPETKEFFRSSEFFVWGLTAFLVLVAALFSGALNATRAWTLVAVLSAAYIVSRGISKAGTARGWEERLPD
jgi:hypothetical protein